MKLWNKTNDKKDIKEVAVQSLCEHSATDYAHIHLRSSARDRLLGNPPSSSE